MAVNSVLVSSSDHPRLARLPAVCRGRVVRAPGAVTDQMTVVLINFTSDWEFEVPAGNWDPRDGLLPEAGNECAVIFDDDGDAWIPVWSPYA